MFEELQTALKDCPVTDGFLHDIAHWWTHGGVPVISAGTGSGKTLKIPTYLSDLEPDRTIVVLVPKRFLARNAAYTVNLLSGTLPANTVGYAVSETGLSDRHHHRDNRIVFMTYGYALQSGALERYTRFIIDEAHEEPIDQSIAEAVFHRRLDRGDDIRLAIMSATIDRGVYLGKFPNTKEFAIEVPGRYPIKDYHIPSVDLIDLIRLRIDEGEHGILVFTYGIKEVAALAKKCREQLADLEPQVLTLTSQTDPANLAEIEEPLPKGHIRILIGTNVAESGANLPWVDAVISDGFTKVPMWHNGAERLALELLPQWRCTQQRGRVGRNKPGTFILAHPEPVTARAAKHPPEILRRSLESVVLTCAAFGLDAAGAHFVHSPPRKALRDAEETLLKLEFIERQDDGRVVLTKAGSRATRLPVGYREAALLLHAEAQGCLPEILPLIAVAKVGDLRTRDASVWVGTQSAELIAQAFILATYRKRRQDRIGHSSIRKKTAVEAMDTIAQLELHYKVKTNWDVWDLDTFKLPRNVESTIKQCIFGAYNDKFRPSLNGRAHMAAPWLLTERMEGCAGETSQEFIYQNKRNGATVVLVNPCYFTADELFELCDHGFPHMRKETGRVYDTLYFREQLICRKAVPVQTKSVSEMLAELFRKAEEPPPPPTVEEVLTRSRERATAEELRKLQAFFK